MKLSPYIVPIAVASLCGTLATAQPTHPPEQDASTIAIGRLRPSPDIIVRAVFIGNLELKCTAGRAEMGKRVAAAIDNMHVSYTPRICFILADAQDTRPSRPPPSRLLSSRALAASARWVDRGAAV